MALATAMMDRHLLNPGAALWLPCHHQSHDEGSECIRLKGSAEVYYADGIIEGADGSAIVVAEGGSWLDKLWGREIVGPVELWYRDNVLDREDGPAISSPDVEFERLACMVRVATGTLYSERSLC